MNITNKFVQILRKKKSLANKNVDLFSYVFSIESLIGIVRSKACILKINDKTVKIIVQKDTSAKHIVIHKEKLCSNKSKILTN